MVTRMDGCTDSDLISSITPDVMACLRRAHFFERLDDRLSPEGGHEAREVCGGNYKLSKSILEVAGFDSADLEDIFNVLRSQGACCDCEVLYNVAESSRLKADYWRNQAESLDAKAKHQSHPGRGR
jgi:Protein of unknown function (DUF2695)